MFRDALFESSPALRQRNAWPMATAFTLQMIIASAMVLLPLISTGVIPISRNLAPVWIPLPAVQHSTPRTSAPSTGSGPTLHQAQVIQVQTSGRGPVDRNLKPTNSTQEPDNPLAPIGPGNDNALPSNLFDNSNSNPPARPKPPRISRSMDAMLLNKVIPDYPAIARMAGVQGEVQLHAIIGRDGTIQSLTVTSGPPLLQESARNAVQQWRYRPYMLNGEAVEVETIITVSFKKF